MPLTQQHGRQRAAGPDLDKTVDAAMRELGRLREQMANASLQTARAAVATLFSEIGLLFHTREGGKGRHHLARVLIQPKSQIHFYAGNRI